MAVQAAHGVIAVAKEVGLLVNDGSCKTMNRWHYGATLGRGTAGQHHRLEVHSTAALLGGFLPRCKWAESPELPSGHPVGISPSGPHKGLSSPLHFM